MFRFISVVDKLRRGSPNHKYLYQNEEYLTFFGAEIKEENLCFVGNVGTVLKKMLSFVLHAERKWNR